MTKKFFKSFSLLTFFSGVFALSAQAIDISNKYIEITAGQGGFQTLKDPNFFSSTIGLFISIVLGFVGIIFVVYIIYGGYEWMTAQGNDEKVNSGRKRIRDASIGVFIIISAYAVTSFIFTTIQEKTDRKVSQSSQAGYCDTDADCPVDAPTCKQDFGIGVFGACTCTENYCNTDTNYRRTFSVQGPAHCISSPIAIRASGCRPESELQCWPLNVYTETCDSVAACNKDPRYPPVLKGYCNDYALCECRR